MNFGLADSTISVIGLGYVGLPLAEAFSHTFKVIGFDVNGHKVEGLAARSGRNSRLELTADPARIGEARFIIICVPTPVTAAKEPDLSCITSAANLAAPHLKEGAVVVLESTVYPGVTEEVVKPILEKGSGMVCGRDFKIGYSPERVNPGDPDHSISTTTKVVAGMDSETTKLLVDLYSCVAPKVYAARDIRTAEACKVVENVQRDLNIALINEIALICGRIGLDVRDVLDAAATKWNFQKYSPGLVGGHCIPVVPYFLIHKAVEAGYEPRIIRAGRAVNDAMPAHVASLTIEALNDAGKTLRGAEVLIMGLSYKENVPDSRESQVKGIIEELRRSGVRVYGHDPLLGEIEREFGVTGVRDLDKAPRVDAVILAVVHDQFRKIRLGQLKAIMRQNPILVDIRRAYTREEAERAGFRYKTL